jgi:hypothetical protein
MRRTTQQRVASVLRKFGENEFDDHEFSGDFSLSEKGGNEDDLPSRSPSPDAMPPGFQQPFKFRRESGNFDTFQYKRSHSRGLSITKRDSKKRNQQRPAIHEEDPRLSTNEGKRPPPSPNKNSTPKRRRTLMEWEFSPESSVIVNNTEQVSIAHLKIQAAIKSKRKDSRTGSVVIRADPAVLARRQILRPRNPTPRQRRRLGSSQLEDGEGEEFEDEEYEDDNDNENEENEEIQKPEEHLPNVPELSDAMQESIIASELESFTNRIGAHPEDEMGRKSVTTQDYLDEALKVMNFLRAQGRPNVDMGHAAESRLEDIQEDTFESQDGFDMDSNSFSRPPSREDGKGGWRPRVSQRRASVEERLRRFQEPEDDSYLQSSSIAASKQHANVPSKQIETVESEPSGISILPQATRQDHGDTAPDSHQSLGSDQSHRTNASGGSSLAHTTTSKRSETVNTIALEAVSAMIPESVAGLHYDKTKKAWIKQKIPHLATPTPTSDDDPFNNIPDLTFDAEEEAHRLQNAQSRSSGRAAPMSGIKPSGQSEQNAVNLTHHGDEHKDHPIGKKTALESAQTPLKGYKRPVSDFLASSSLLPSPLISQTVPMGSAVDDIQCLQELPPSPAGFPSGTPDNARDIHFSYKSPSGDGCEAEEAEDSQLAVSPSLLESPVPRCRVSSHNTSPIMHLPSPSPSAPLLPYCQLPPPNSQRDASFLRAVALFESEKTSHKQTTPAIEPPQLLYQNARANHSGDGLISTFEVHPIVQSQPTIPIIQLSPTSRPPIEASSQSRLSPTQTSHNSVAISTQFPPPTTLSATETPEKKLQTVSHNPLSVISANALIPPLFPVNSLALQSSPGAHYSTFLLSELGDLTVHQDDEINHPYREIVSKHSGRTTFENRFEAGDQLLIEALTDNYSSTVDWTTLTQVSLSNKRLTSLRLLKELCPNIMDLDASDNVLFNVQGLPDRALRHLTLCNNNLGGTTSAFGFFNRSLEHINVSENRIESLALFRNLGHNINIVIDRNVVRELDGIEGSTFHPISIQMRYNELSGIQSVDIPNFSNLTNLNLSHNQITNLYGIGQLKSLEHLDVSYNKLEAIEPLDELEVLKTINLSNNKLTVLESNIPAKVTELDLSCNELHRIAMVFQGNVVDNVALQENNLAGENIGISKTGELCIGHLNIRSQQANLDCLLFFTNRDIRVVELLLGNNKFDSKLFAKHAFLPDTLSEAMINYVELASCELEALPSNMHTLFPYTRMFNLNFNNLTSINNLYACSKLNILLIAGNKLKGLRDTARGISALTALKVLDTRGNPFSKGHHDTELLFSMLGQLPPGGIKTAHVYNHYENMKKSKMLKAITDRPNQTAACFWDQVTQIKYDGDLFSLAWTHTRHFDELYQLDLEKASPKEYMKRCFWDLIMRVSFGNRLQMLDGLPQEARYEEHLLTTAEAAMLDKIVNYGVLTREEVSHVIYPSASSTVRAVSATLPAIGEEPEDTA